MPVVSQCPTHPEIGISSGALSGFLCTRVVKMSLFSPQLQSQGFVAIELNLDERTRNALLYVRTVRKVCTAEGGAPNATLGFNERRS